MWAMERLPLQLANHYLKIDCEQNAAHHEKWLTKPEVAGQYIQAGNINSMNKSVSILQPIWIF